MFSIKKCVLTKDTTYTLLNITYQGCYTTPELFASHHQVEYCEDNGGTGWFQVVGNPEYNVKKGTTSALVLLEIAHSETTLELDENFEVFALAVEGLFDQPISENTKIAAYELATCELEYSYTIKNGLLRKVEQLPLTVHVMDVLRNLNSLNKLPIEQVNF